MSGHKPRTTDATLTTGDVARLCNVSPRLAQKWFDTGKIAGAIRLPGSRDRRAPRAGVVRFLTDHGFPLGWLDESPPRVLLVGLSPPDGGRLSAALSAAGLDPRVAHDLFTAGVLFGTDSPRVVVVGDGVPAAEARGVVVLVRTLADPPAAFVVVSDDYPLERDGVPHGAQAAYRHPLDPAAVAARAAVLCAPSVKADAGNAERNGRHAAHTHKEPSCHR